VCVGLGVGTAVVNVRVSVMGFLGVISAPLAFEASRVLHKGALEALAVTGSGHDDLSPLAVANLAVGLLVGLVFGGSEIAYATSGTFQLSPTDFLSEGVNQILFPAGCSLALFAAAALGKKATHPDQA
jgi:hypothetical protein